MRPLVTALTSPATHGADRPDALVVAGRAMSRTDLLGAATAVADKIADAKTIAVRATPTLETVAAVLGGLIAGVPVVPVPPDSGPLEREHILRDSGATLLLDPDGVWDKDSLAVDLNARSGTAHPVPGDDATALILYTSGTTGPPKGVLVPHGAVAADLDALAEAWSWSADDVLVHGLPLFHVHGLVLGVLGALRTGSRLVHTGKPTPQSYADAAAEHGGTLFFGVPTVWSRIAEDPSVARQLRGARLLVSGSAALPVPVFEKLYALTGHKVVERYGMTESLITISARADGERRPGFVGTPLAGVRTRVVDDAGQELPHDGESIGELQIQSPTLFHGYLNQPEATAASHTIDGWFRTGDVAAVDADGWHRIVGRASTDLIKSGGYRIGAGEVEGALLAHPSVREAAVIGLPHPDLGQEVVAYVVTSSDVSGKDLTDFVASRLSTHKRPRRVFVVADLPRNAMGKIQKKLLTAD